jgi:hypothetical protein
MAETGTKNPVQLKFFERLKQSVPPNVSLANDIADVLEISADGAYRRMRGESILSLDEMVKLCRHYKVSSDFLGGADDTTATFHFQKMISDEKGFGEYIKNILNDLQKIKASDPKHIVYAAGDLPLFIQFISPEYSAFKMFFWQRAVLSLPSVEGKKFSASDIKPESAEMCKKIADTYMQIPSTEIWHQDTVASNLNLIEFAWESGMFASKEDALLICKKLSEMLELVEKQAEKGTKFREEGIPIAIGRAENEGNFTMYQSEFVLMNNHIFVTAGNTKTLYLTHNTFNSMATTNEVFCCETEEWLKNLIRKSTRISGTGEKQRHKFFKNSQEKIAALVARISA